MSNFKNKKKKLIVLGLSYLARDTSAVIMQNGQVISCCEEERYNFEKHTRAFPINAIKDCLKMAGLKINKIDKIAIGFDPDLYHNYKIKINRRPMPKQSEVRNEIKKLLNYKGLIEFHEHHLSHCASSYFPSGFDDSLVISNDGIGEVACSMICHGKKNNINIIKRENFFPNSIGIAYSAITKYLGWGSGDEGIVMGLAPFGNRNQIVPGKKKSYKSYFKKIIKNKNLKYEIDSKWFAFPRVRDKWITNLFIRTFGKKRERDTEINQNHKNVASAIQGRIEDILINQLKYLNKKKRYKKLCIAGGVGLNCSLNGKIEQLKIFEEIFITPASGDNGISLGAAYLSTVNEGIKIKKKKITNLSLGSKYTNDEILKVLKNYKNINYEKPRKFYQKIAKNIYNKKIIGWFQGGSEFGPRALGNRSILASPFPENMRDHVNNEVKFRESFRPFAPAVLEEDASKFFEIRQKSPYMLIASKVKKDKIKKIPAVVHVDGSARLQSVNKIDNDVFYKLLKAFKKISGIPVLMNTSFNVKGQPIVNNPKIAIDTFLKTKIDILVIGNFIVKKK